MTSLHTAIHAALDSGKRWEDSDDILLDDRILLVAAWRDDASKTEINEAYLAGEDDDDMLTLLDFAVGEPVCRAQRAMLNCFWAGMKWRVDSALSEVKASIRQDRLDEERNFQLEHVE